MGSSVRDKYLGGYLKEDDMETLYNELPDPWDLKASTARIAEEFGTYGQSLFYDPIVKKILSVGCGLGQELECYAGACAAFQLPIPSIMVGLDISKKAIEGAWKHAEYINANFSKEYPQLLQLRAPFDLVIVRDVTYYSYNASKMVDHIVRSVFVGGKVLIGDSLRRNKYRDMLTKRSEFEGGLLGEYASRLCKGKIYKSVLIRRTK